MNMLPSSLALSAQHHMAPFYEIHSPTYPTPPGVYPSTYLPGYTYQPTYPTYAHPVTYSSRYMPWDPNSLNSTNLSTYFSPVKTIHKQDTYLPYMLDSSRYMSWDPYLLTSTNMLTNSSPVNTICRQDTHRLTSISKSQYSSSRTRPPAILKLSDAQTPAQAWDDLYKLSSYVSESRYEHALSLIFRYWTSQDVSRRCVIINLTSPSTIS